MIKKGEQYGKQLEKVMGQIKQHIYNQFKKLNQNVKTK